MQYFYCARDQVFTLRIKFPQPDAVNLNESKTTPTVLFHTGSLYFTIWGSQARSVDPNGKIDLELRLEADCDVAKTEILEDYSLPTDS